MAAVSVVFNGTRINPSDSNTNWGNWGSTGGSPSAESPIAYQNSIAVNKKINSTTLGGIDYNPGSGGIDMTTSDNPLFFVKAIASDSFDLNTTYGMKIGIGSANNAYYEYNIAGSGSNLSVYNEYPVQGGYLITSINPNITAWRENTIGSPSLTSVDWFGLQAAFIVGAAKAENLALDAIDIGTGLTLTSGDGISADGTFVDFVDFDQNISTNRYGVVTGKGDSVTSNGLLTIGTSSITEFSDSTSIVIFSDGYHSRGLVGVKVGMNNTGSTINIGSLLIGEGSRNGVDANDTRPDFSVIGTLGTFSCSSTMRNFRDVTFTSICDVESADIECHLLVQDSCNISNSTIRTNSLTSEACLQDPTFGTTSGLYNVTFIQSGSGHAIELNTATTYNLKNIFFKGYGSNATDTAALDITASSGTVTINIDGGDTPTYKTAGASVIINNSVSVRLTILDALNSLPVEGSRVLLTASSGGDLTTGTVILSGLSNIEGVIEDSGFNFTNPQPVVGKVRKGTTTPLYKQAPISGTITSSGLETTIFLISDE